MLASQITKRQIVHRKLYVIFSLLDYFYLNHRLDFRVGDNVVSIINIDNKITSKFSIGFIFDLTEDHEGIFSFIDEIARIFSLGD